MSNFQNDTNYTSSLPEESVLLEQMVEGSMDAFDALYKYFQPKLYRYIQPFTANTGIEPEEIVQDLFVKLWIRREAFAGIRSLEHYLYRMARNRLIDIKRSTGVQQRHYENYISGKPLDADTTTYEIEFREFRKKALEAIQHLPERRRTIFELSVNKGKSLAEIAAALKISTEVARKQLYLASRYVKDYIGDQKLSLIAFLFINSLLMVGS